MGWGDNPDLPGKLCHDLPQHGEARAIDAVVVGEEDAVEATHADSSGEGHSRGMQPLGTRAA